MKSKLPLCGLIIVISFLVVLPSFAIAADEHGIWLSHREFSKGSSRPSLTSKPAEPITEEQTEEQTANVSKPVYPRAVINQQFISEVSYSQMAEQLKVDKPVSAKYRNSEQLLEQFTSPSYVVSKTGKEALRQVEAEK